MAAVENPAVDTVTIEVDGQALTAAKGSMIIEATDQAGIEIPRFCYHRKLSIAANCRMCLVDVEKAPKPLPACATPVADGMKVFTRSRRAADAQRGVMEFLLINHPLDCPICDQGGECELQDLAMGYGRSVSRFTERKRVVKDKNLGPLVATDMTRCIHCTRCVRFLEEIAGTAELGGVGRGEHTEISTFIERNIDSELSGNIIDLCPVGALTNKPFRFSARAWEMSARPYVGTHDCLGSNLFYHVRAGVIKRAVPRDHESINECWLADRDRYSHFGLQAADRLNEPMIKRDGQWCPVDWDRALDEATTRIQGVMNAHGPEQFGVLASPRATTEEHWLLKRLADGLGTPHTDHRLRVLDDRHPLLGLPRMDRPSSALSEADAIFLIGSHLRHDQPILNHRVRTAWRQQQASIMDINPIEWDFPYDLTERLIVPPQQMVDTLAQVLRAATGLNTEQHEDEFHQWLQSVQVHPAAEIIAQRLQAADQGVVLMGDQALMHPQASLLRRLAERLAEQLNIALMVLPGAANSAGACAVNMLPVPERGRSAMAMLRNPLSAYLLHDFDPALDTAEPAVTLAALQQAELVIAQTAFAEPSLLAEADIILPLAPVPETDGSYINLDGQRQWLKAVSKPPANARDGWKILRMLGASLQLPGFDFTHVSEVQFALDQALAVAPATRPLLDDESLLATNDPEPGFWRIGPVPMTHSDGLVRRAEPLQQTAHAQLEYAVMNPDSAAQLGVTAGQSIRLEQAGQVIDIRLELDRGVPANAVWLPSATAHTACLGAAYGPIRVEPAT
ncbi:MAG: NADH-quinone oxidoreductase subunit NuoG [Pseudomonadota bacterium]